MPSAAVPLSQYLVGVEETDRIFTWDAIFEMVLWAGCVMACASLQLWSDTFSTVSDKMFNVFVSAVIVTMGLLLFVMFMYSIINSMREYLSPSAFRAFIVKAAGDCFLLSILFTFISVYGSTSLQTNELPFAYCGNDRAGRVAISLSCPNETAAIAVLEAIPCNVKPLCGFSTWQVACYRIQLANPVRAYYLFGGPLFSIWALVLWACYTLFSQGNANIKAVVPSRRERAPLLRKKKSGGDQAPNDKVSTPSDATSDGGKDAEKRGPSYSHLFEPHMLLAFLLLLFTGILMIYQLARFFTLSAFLVRPTPAIPDPAPVPPGLCYGSCTTYLSMYTWATCGIIIALLLNYDRLRGLLSRLSRSNEELQKQMADERGQKGDRVAEESAAYNFVNRDFILDYKGQQLPVFQELQGMDGALTPRPIDFVKALLVGMPTQMSTASSATGGSSPTSRMTGSSLTRFASTFESTRAFCTSGSTIGACRKAKRKRWRRSRGSTTCSTTSTTFTSASPCLSCSTTHTQAASGRSTRRGCRCSRLASRDSLRRPRSPPLRDRADLECQSRHGSVAREHVGE